MKSCIKKVLLLFTVLMLSILIVACNSDSFSDGNNENANNNGDENSEPFYEGETIEMVIPFEVGGGTDVFARFMQQYLVKHIEGNPDMQPVNIPGGGSVNGANEYVVLREPDGMSILVSSGSTHGPYLLGDPAVEYDLTKLQPVMGVPVGSVVYASPDTGIEGPEDILNAKQDLVYAGISATGADLAALLSFELLGADVKAVLGYEGRGPSRVAFEQGESNIDYQTDSAYKENVVPLVENGKAIPLYTFGQMDANGDLVRDPAFPDLPTVKEVYEQIHGEEPSGIVWEAYKTYAGALFSPQKVIWLHSDAPQEAVDALVAAGESLKQDEEFVAESEVALGGYEIIVGEELQSVVNAIFQTDDEVNEWVINFLKEKHGVERLGG